MESIIHNLFIHNWQHKLMALVSAVILWIFINHTITDTKTIPNIPVRVINLPSDKTIYGLLPNGYLDKRITLTVSGTKEVVEDLEAGDLEVLLDASIYESDDWLVQITKKNLVSLNPSTDLARHITGVTHSGFFVNLSNLVTAQVPILVKQPKGRAPVGYEFLDIWPSNLKQTISGPEEEIERIKFKGLKLIFNLDEISKEELDAIKESQKHSPNDEVSFLVPESWKKVPVPFRRFAQETVNDPRAKNLRIIFLRKKLIPVEKEIPIQIFYPLKYSKTINPETYKVKENEFVKIENGIPRFTYPVFVEGVSALFVDIIKNNLQIVISAAPKEERKYLEWSLEIVDAKELESTYVAYILANISSDKSNMTFNSLQEESTLRRRFREYLSRMKLLVNSKDKLSLKNTLGDGEIEIIPKLD